MPNLSTSLMRTAAVAALVSGLAFASPLYAAPGDPPPPPENAMGQPSPPPPPGHHGPGDRMVHSPQAEAQRVEARIKTLHDKLGITKDQEAKWGDVAQAMRDNQTTIDQLIQERHQNPANMTAVDDLQSYEKITQAHVDGLQKLIPAFQSLYSDMSDEQKKSADQAFSRFEGHHADIPAKKHS